MFNELVLTNAYSRERMDQPEYVQEPEHDDNNHHCVQNGLDASGHGDEAIYEPQQNANDDQYSYKVNQGQDRFASFFARRHPDQPKIGPCFRVRPRGYATGVEPRGTWKF